MIQKMQLQAFFKAVSILMFFITFFTDYIFFGGEIVDCLFKGIITLIVANIFLNLVYIIWRFAFKAEEWKLIIEGEKTDSVEEDFPIEEELPDMPLSTETVKKPI